MNMGAAQGPADGGPFPDMRTENARVVVEDSDNEPCFDSAEEKAAAERAHLTARRVHKQSTTFSGAWLAHQSTRSPATQACALMLDGSSLRVCW